MPKYDPCKGIEPMVRMIVGRLHVGDPDREAADYVASRMAKGVSRHDIRRVRACAVRLHRENRDLYRAVMR